MSRGPEGCGQPSLCSNSLFASPCREAAVCKAPPPDMKEIHWLSLQKVPRSMVLLELSPGIKELACTIHLSFSFSLTIQALGVPFWHLPSTSLGSLALPGVPLAHATHPPWPALFHSSSRPATPRGQPWLGLVFHTQRMASDWTRMLLKAASTPEGSSSAHQDTTPSSLWLDLATRPGELRPGLRISLAGGSPSSPTHLQQTQPGLGDVTRRDRLGLGMLCCGACT